MKRTILIAGFSLFSFLLQAQFEQKVSINISAGMFKTFGGEYGHRPDGEPRPKQMPNYKAGLASELGIQYNINRRFSVAAELGIMYSSKWELISSDGYDWMHWDNYKDDTLLVGSGYNNLNLFNLSIGIKPKLYFLPGKKFNPFFYTGISINYSHAKFKDNQWDDFVANGLNEPDDHPYNPWLKKNIGLGINPGLGIEYNPSENISVFLTGGYYHIFMNKKSFVYDYEPETKADLNAIMFQAGIRYSFIKSKNL